MKRFLKTIRLTQGFSFKFGGAPPSEIIRGLQFIMDYESGGFSASNRQRKKFIGFVEGTRFTLMRRGMLQLNGAYVKASGQMRKVNDDVFVETEVGVNNAFMIAVALWIIANLGIVAIIISRGSSTAEILKAIGAFGGFLLLSLGLWYVFALMAVQKLKRQLEQDFPGILS
jgi:hypothetical protein